MSEWSMHYKASSHLFMCYAIPVKTGMQVYHVLEYKIVLPIWVQKHTYVVLRGFNQVIFLDQHGPQDKNSWFPLLCWLILNLHKVSEC